MSVGIIDSEGYYELSTNRELGLESGEYKVTVVSRERGAVTEDGAPPLPGKHLIPVKYGSYDTSGLQFTIERGANNIDLELKS